MDDMNNYRMKHESDKEWSMRRAFLLAHREKFSDSRLRCLASCYINVECYGCRYPPALMRQLGELMAELPKQGSLRSGKHGLPLPVRFVPAGQAGDKLESKDSQISRVPSSVPDTVNPQPCLNKPSDTLPQSSTKLSRLEASFHCLADKLKDVYHSKSLTGSKSEVELVQIAVDKARMSATTQFTELGPGKGFRCDLSLDFVLVSSGEAQNKRLAKNGAYVAAAELLQKAHLRVSENAKPGVSNLQLVASHDPSFGENLPHQRGAESVSTADHLPPRMAAVSHVMDKNPSLSTQRSCVQSGTKRSSDSLHQASLKDFVILQSANATQVLQQSADFNKWSLEYDMSEMDGQCRCRVILGDHVLSDAVGENKSAAKTAASDQALKELQSICCTVVIKRLGDIEPDDTLKRSEVCSIVLLWSPYVIGQTIKFMPCDFFLFFSSPNLSGWRLDGYHMVWP